MNLTGVHFLLTYRCDTECDHCFVWGSPFQKGVIKLKEILFLLNEIRKVEAVKEISLEGGEPFLYYPIMVKAAKEAVKLGFSVEIVTNGYWACSVEDALEWLKPFAEIENISLSLSSDYFHGEKWITEEAENAVKAAKKLGIPIIILAVSNPNISEKCPNEVLGVPVDISELRFRGRAAEKLVKNVEKGNWTEFKECPYEDLADPVRVHIDPLGYVHVCQGICIGNAFQKSFSKIIKEYKPYSHPIVEALLKNGPFGLAQKYGVPHKEFYADACHFCYEIRCTLRKLLPEVSEFLAPDQVYGEDLS